MAPSMSSTRKARLCEECGAGMVSRDRAMLIAAAFLAVALSTALAPVPLGANQRPVRVIRFGGGEAIIERHGAEEHVVVKRHGQIASISDCDRTSGTYDQIVQFSTAIKSAA